MLDYVLLGTPASALRKALIDSGLGEDVTGSGLETEMKQLFFGAGLKGVHERDIDAVAELSACRTRLHVTDIGTWTR